MDNDNGYRNDRTDKPSGNMPDDFDLLLGSLQGIPGVTSTRESTITDLPPMGMGGSRVFIVQTYRKRDLVSEEPKPAKDTIFLQCLGKDAHTFRIAIPSGVADVIARQRDALSTKSRVTTARRLAAERKAAGIVPNTEGLRRARAAKKNRKGKK